MKKLDELSLMANQRAYQNFHNIFEISRIFGGYPKLANDAMNFMFTVDGKTPKPMLKGLMGAVKKNATLGQLAADGWKAYRSL
jgi:electron transfer flavoprotein-quinone oxidoreductase